jgi:citrate synthase
MTIQTQIGYATVQDIFVRGKNLSTEIIPNTDFVDMVCLCMLGKTPDANFKRMINVLLVTSTDHGFTPSSMASRLTILGAPESLQGAVAAGLLGAGDRYLGVTQNVASMLQTESEGLAANAPQFEFDARARDLLARYKAEKRRIHGVGHPIHVDGDPRVPALRKISQETGYYRSGWRLLDAIETINRVEFDRKLPINGAGAMGAIAADLGLDPRAARGLALVGRAAGLAAHILEEVMTPTATDMWDLVLEAEAEAASKA